ncbi:ABC transporter permease [Leptolyngbya sp. AN03gr2]|uniref:ABC transporter permease n=1 Tax=unclassified Leptolyngbya TaxID=2650499 RepID=UPI003D31EC34
MKLKLRHRSTSEPQNWMPRLDRLLPLFGVIVLLALWEFVSKSGWINPVLLPTPVDTVTELFNVAFRSEDSLFTDFATTVWRTTQAFAIATVLGVPLGIILGSNERLYRSVEFLIDFFRSTPASALIPMFLLFLGTSDWNKVVIPAFAGFLVIVFNSAYGVMNARQSRILAARVMGASQWDIFKDVLFWESLPQTFIGLRTGISIALVMVIVAEMFIGTESGLGKRIIETQQVLNVKDMYASVLITGVLGYSLNMLFRFTEKRIVHWSGR